MSPSAAELSVGPPYRADPADARNYDSRKATPISFLVLHTAEGSLAGALQRFRDPSQRASAHWGISRAGELVQWVTEDYCAWHCGNKAINRRSVGIELEAHAAAGDFTEPMLATLTRLLAWDCRKHIIPADRIHIFGHAEVPDPNDPHLSGGISHHTDPGPHFPWGRVIHDIGELLADP